jgi:hypothetical protein
MIDTKQKISHSDLSHQKTLLAFKETEEKKVQDCTHHDDTQQICQEDKPNEFASGYVSYIVS